MNPVKNNLRQPVKATPTAARQPVKAGKRAANLPKIRCYNFGMAENIKAVTKRLQEFANQHKLILELEGECGFGRECVGLNTGGSWLDYNPHKLNGDYEQIPELYDDRLRAPDGVDAYHKHECFAVLGRGDKAIRQLDRWITSIIAQGEVEVITYETGATGIQALVSGVTGKALVFKKRAGAQS